MQPAADPAHDHFFNDHNPVAEKRTRQVMWLTAVMMVVEIVAGTVFGSMALLADGWHMSSHALALGLAAGAYAFARRYASDHRFAFGTWKIEVLGGYTSAVLLMGVAGYMGFESIRRLIEPAPIRFDEAIPVAILGLAVNVVSAWLLSTGESSHSHGHDHGGADHHRHRDLNLRAAYLHVVADAATSVLAVGALVGGRYFGASWLDPLMGLAGTVLVARWAWGLLRESGRVLLDAEMDAPVVEEVRAVVANLDSGAVLRDLHVWRVGRGKYACILCIESSVALQTDEVRRALAIHEELVHVTVELNTLAGRPPADGQTAP